MNRRTFVLLSGAASGSLLVPLRGSRGGVPLDDGRLSFEFDGRHRWSLWYRGAGAAVPLLPFTSAGVHLGDRLLTLGDLDDVSLQAGTPPTGESTIIRGRAAGLFVEATFLTEPSAPAPRASVTLRIYPDTEMAVVSGFSWASLPVDRALAGPGELLAQIDESSPAIVPLTSTSEIRSNGTLALTRRSGAARALGIIEEPGGAGGGAFQAALAGGVLTLDSPWVPPRPVSTAGDTQTVTFCYRPQGDGLAALSGACAPPEGDRDFLASLGPPAGLWLSGSQGRGEDLPDLLDRAARILDPHFAPFVAFGPGDGTPRGHRWCTDQIHAAGLLAAVSLAPFVPGEATPEAIRERARVAVQDWGYDALILDGLDAVWPDLERLSAGLAAIHEVAGSALIWSGSVVPQTGTIAVARVGDAPSPGWESAARRATAAGLRSFYHRAWWLNDPGPWSLGYPLSLTETRTQLSLAALLGATMTFTADVLDIPDAQTDLVRRALPPAPVTGRPLDAGPGVTPALWTAHTADWRTALVINWDDQPLDRTVRLADLGLPAGAYHGYDVWRDVPRRVTDPLPVTLDAHDCLVLGLRPRGDHPLVIGTTRHVVQGSVDLVDEHWDGKAQTLSGRAVKLDGRPYGVTIAAAGWAADELHADRPGTVRVIDSEYLVLEWPGGERGDLAWQLSLKRAGHPRRPRSR